METLFKDIRYGVRSLLKRPGFTAIVVITLALGIGANTAIFSVVNGVLLHPQPYNEPQQLVMVWATRSLNQEFPVMSADFVDLRNQNHVFEQVAAFHSQPLDLTGSGEPENLGGIRASTNLFSLLGIQALQGRTFLTEEDKPGNNHVAILSYGLWQRRFGSNQKLIGQTIALNGEPYVVVGVMPPDFQFPRKADLPAEDRFPGEVEIYTPLALTAEQENDRGRTSLTVIARLKPQVSIGQAGAEIAGIAAQLRQQYPNTNKDKDMRLVPFQQQVVSRVRLPLLVLLGAVGFVLLIACTNVANLLLVRAAAQRKEIAIRAALGAGRWRVVRQLLTESLLLAMIGGAFALLVAFWSVQLLRTIMPDNVPRTDEIRIDGLVFAFTLLVSLVTGILLGLLPAIQAAKLNLSDVLKEGGRRSAAIGHNRSRSVLVVAEVAMALVLLTGAGLMLRSFMRLIRVDLGINPRNVLTADIRLPSRRYGPTQEPIFFEQLLSRLRALPGVQAAGAIFPLPLSETEDSIGFRIEGQPAAFGEWLTAGPRCVGTDYFKTLNIQLQKGRVFAESDGGNSPPVLVINEAMAHEYWPNQDPIGRRIALNSHDGQLTWREIVGVISDVRHMGLDRGARPEIYFPVSQFPFPFMTVVVRTNGDPLKFVAAVRKQVQAIDKDQPISNIHTMEELLGRSVSQRRFNLLLLATFAGLALLLASIGIYGVMSFLVTQRSHEIGIRMALGAQMSDVLRLVVRDGMTLTLIGIAVGLAGSFALTRLMKSLLFEVTPNDAATLVAVSGLLIFTALLACYLPARRATKVDPLVALRYE